jgi:NAD(P)-dependent dehydrogenase (short-subunit alcohol dehydrogenase family)
MTFSRESDVLLVRDQVTSALGAPSVLVNAAGAFALARVPDMSEEDSDWILDVNLKGTFLTCKAFFPVMIEARSGVIVNIASTTGIRSAKDRAAYCASKREVVLFTGAPGADHGPDAVRINCVCPGIIDSSMASWIKGDPEVLEVWARSIPVDSMGKVEEVASVVASLASEEADYVHGATFVVDGGESK